MTQTASEGWKEVAAKFWTTRRETPTSEIEDMAAFGALVCAESYGLMDTKEKCEQYVLAALKREIGGKG